MAAVPSEHLRALKVAVALSAVGLVGKWSAYVLTGSVAIFSDALESLIHIAAIGIAWHGMQVSFRPPDVEHPFGHAKAAYFSAGLEGGLIILAAVLIGVAAVDKLVSGVALRKLDIGLGMTGLVAVLNAILGRWLLREGRRLHSPILHAHGKHILADVVTTAGTIAGLSAAWATGWWVLDPILALVVALNIVREGARLLWRSAHGLMDRSNPELESRARQALEEFCREHGIRYHRLRLREAGAQVYIDVHLQFRDGTPIEQAHGLATAAEQAIAQALPVHADIVTHLEGEEHAADHDDPKPPDRLQELRR